MNTSIAPLIVESERVLTEAIQHFGLKVPAANIVVTIQSKGRKKAVGWFAPERWKPGTQKTNIHEINISAELIKTYDTGELLLHELAHAENNFLEIQDCSGRAHNKHFKSMAERLGLEVKPRDKAVGYGYTDLGPEGKSFLTKIAFKRELFELHRVQAGAKTAGPGSRMLKCECPACGYVARITQKWIDAGLPTCPCGEEMEAV
jgi:hypothetical protein